LVRNVRERLARIYHNLGDEDQQAHHERLAAQLDEELELVCGACNLPYGCEADSLEALPCAHILHARCAYDLLRHRGSKKRNKGPRQCPDCQRLVSSRLYLCCDEARRSMISLRSSPSMASLRSYTNNQATSSV
jgi:hypothetical protein